MSSTEAWSGAANEPPLWDEESGSTSLGGSTRMDAPLWRHPLGQVFFSERVADGSQWLRVVLHKSLSADADAVARCRRDARVATTLGSDFLWPSTAVELRPDRHIELLSPYPPAVALVDSIAEGPMSPARAVGILRQICHGVAVLHRAGLVHGALSAASVLLAVQRGRQDAVRIVDIGLAPLLDTASMGDTDAAWQPLSPEKILGLSCDHREDVYLVGALGYALLAGRPLFMSPIAEEVRRSHAIEDPPKLRNVAPGVPRALSRVIAGCLAKDPDDRPASIAELDASLSELARGAGLTSPWNDLPPLPQSSARTRKPESRRPALRSKAPESFEIVLESPLELLAQSGARSRTAAGTIDVESGSSMPYSDAVETQGRRGWMLGVAAVLLVGVVLAWAMMTGVLPEFGAKSPLPAATTEPVRAAVPDTPVEAAPVATPEPAVSPTVIEVERPSPPIPMVVETSPPPTKTVRVRKIPPTSRKSFSSTQSLPSPPVAELPSLEEGASSPSLPPAEPPAPARPAPTEPTPSKAKAADGYAAPLEAPRIPEGW